MAVHIKDEWRGQPTTQGSNFGGELVEILFRELVKNEHSRKTIQQRAQAGEDDEGRFVAGCRDLKGPSEHLRASNFPLWSLPPAYGLLHARSESNPKRKGRAHDPSLHGKRGFVGDRLRHRRRRPKPVPQDISGRLLEMY